MSLQFIFDELCKGNLSVMTNEAYQLIAEKTLEFNSGNESDEDLKLLVMISNILYNRTDMTMLPIEDSVYDTLMEAYKKIDPNFQVGSVVVEFQQQAQDIMDIKGENKPVDVFNFYDPIKRDEVQDYYHNQLMGFDKGKYNHEDIFGEKSPIYDNGPISKGLHDTKHNHPTLIGTLDKAKFVLDIDAIEMDVYDKPNTSILERDFFRKHINMGIITEDQPLEMVLELKYDGISVEADCSDIVESARTRGDTGIGEAVDITPMLYGYKFPRNKVLKDRIIGVKFEAIINYADLQKFNQIRGANYANARTAMVGLFGSSDSYLYRDLITLIPLAVDREDVPEIKNRMEEIELLNNLFKTKGEPLRYAYIKGTYQECLFLIKKFVEEANYARDYLNFMFDGVVVSYLDENIRNALGRENYINKYSIAVKFDPMSKLTTFLGYTFNVGQSGNICPMIHYTPVEFIGTIHPKSSGSSRKRFMDLALRMGDVIKVTYTNEVMPYVTRVDCEQNRNNPNPLIEFPTHCPCCGTELEVSASGDSAKCPNWYCNDRIVARLTATLSKLGISGFAEASVRALQVANLFQIYQMSEETLIKYLGNADGENLYYQLRQVQQNPIQPYILFGALGFSGIGKETWKKIFDAVGFETFYQNYTEDRGNREKINNILISYKGIGQSTVDIIDYEYQYFELDINYFVNTFNIITINPSETRMTIRFSGVRDRVLEEMLRNVFIDADGDAGITRKTDLLIIPYQGFQSTKVEKAEGYGIPIISIVDFKDDIFTHLPDMDDDEIEYILQTLNIMDEN